jgi:hypothetical protein
MFPNLAFFVEAVVLGAFEVAARDDADDAAGFDDG